MPSDTVIIKLGNPRPRKRPKSFRDAFELRPIKREYLPVAEKLPQRDLFSVLAERRSERNLQRLTRAQLSELLWCSMRTQGVWKNAFGDRRELRPTPSAGACHPHDLLLLERTGRRWRVALYQPASHALDVLDAPGRQVTALIREVNKVLPTGAATVVFFVGFPTRTARYYTHPESLLWRDAGVIIGVMALVAAGLQLGFCPLGITGEPFVSRLLQSNGNAIGFGGVVIGARRTSRR